MVSPTLLKFTHSAGRISPFSIWSDPTETVGMTLLKFCFHLTTCNLCTRLGLHGAEAFLAATARTCGALPRNCLATSRLPTRRAPSRRPSTNSPSSRRVCSHSEGPEFSATHLGGRGTSALCSIAWRSSNTLANVSMVSSGGPPTSTGWGQLGRLPCACQRFRF
jgi:hypothetical protein